MPASAAVKTWVSAGPDAANTSGAWSPAGVPAGGDDIVFNGSGVGNCNWNLTGTFGSFTLAPGYNGIVSLTNTGGFTTNGPFNVHSGTVQFADGSFTHFLDGGVNVVGGQFSVGQSSVFINSSIVSSMTVYSGGMLDLHNHAILRVSTLTVLAGGVLHAADFPTSGNTLIGSTGPASRLYVTLMGTVDVDSVTFASLTPKGLRIAGGANISTFSRISFEDLLPGTTAISFVSPGTVVATFSAVNFGHANIAVNINAALLDGGSRITVRGERGARSGPFFSNDPNIPPFIEWPDRPKGSVLTPSQPTWGTFASITGDAYAFGGAAFAPGGNVFLRIRRVSDNNFWDGGAFTATPTDLGVSFSGGSTGTWSYTSGAIDGYLVSGQTYELILFVIDSFNRGEMYSAGKVFDTVAPVVFISTPATGTTWAGFPAISGTAADDGQITNVELSISSGPFHTTRWNGSAWTTPVPVSVTSLFASSWSYTNVPTGPNLTPNTTYTIRARGIDNATNVGNFTVSVSTFYYTGGTPPFGAVTFPAGPNVSSLASISGTAEAFAGAEISPSGVEVAIRQISNNQWWDWSTSFSAGSPIFQAGAFIGNSSGTWSISVPGIDSGLIPSNNYEVKVRVTDTLSQVFVDNSAPVFQYQPPAVPIYVEGEEIAPAFFNQNDNNVPVMRLRLWRESGSQVLNSLRVVMFGDAPATSITAKVWRDEGYDGILHSTDTLLGSMAFAVGGPEPFPTANITSLGQTINTTTTQLFVTFSMSNLPGGKVIGAGIFSGYEFGGLTDVDETNLPIYFGERDVVAAVAANPIGGGYTSPTGAPTRSGGFDSGLFLNNGQQFFVFSTGTWSDGVNGTFPPSGAGAGTGGLETALNLGALVGRIGSSPWFEIGAGGYFTASQNGNLFLAMNDSGYSNNSGAISVGFHVLPSTTPHVWLGGSSGFENRASIPANWSGGKPNPGEIVVFDGAAGYDCDWDLPSMYLESLVLASTFTRTLRLVSASGNQPNYLEIGTTTVLGGGTLDLGYGNTFTVGGDLLVSGATLDMGSGILRAGKVELRGGAIFKSRSNSLEARIERGYTSDTLGFEVYDATTVVDGTMGLRMYDVGRVLIASSAVTTAFDRVQLYRWDANTDAAVVLQGPSSISRVFRNWRFEIAHSTNVNAEGAAAGASFIFQNTDFNGTNQKGGSPFEVDPNNVVSWTPDGGGLGSIGGQLSFPAGSQASDYAVIITTDPKGGGAQLTFRQPLPNNPLPLAYNFNNLQAPNTWYVFGYKGPGQVPQGDDARGGYLFDGWYRSAPIILLPSQNLTGKNVVLGPWHSVTGMATRATPQSGPIRVQAWAGNPPCSSCTFLSQTFADQYGVYALNAPQRVVGPADVAFVAFVDANNNGGHDGFEAFGSSAQWTVPTFLSNVNITVGGGSLPPGGSVYLTATPIHGGLIGNNGPRALVKLQMYSAGSSSTVSGVDVTYDGFMPAYADVSAAIFSDNGNGTFEVYGAQPDIEVGKTSFDFYNGSSITAVSFTSPQQITGSTRTFFLVAGLGGTTEISQFRMLISTSGSFAMSGGAMGVQPGLYPVDSGLAQVGLPVFAGNPAYQGSGGGQFTGLMVYEGQTLQLNAYGAWQTSFSTGMVDARGALDASGSPGQNTVLPSARVGELIGRIDNDGSSTPWFRVGASTTAVAPRNGMLLLAMNDLTGSYYDNNGEVVVTYGISGATQGAISGTLFYEGGLAGTMAVSALRCYDPQCQGFTVMGSTSLSVGAPTSYPYLITGLPAGDYAVYAQHQSDAAQQGRSGAPRSLVLGSTITVNVKAYQGLSAVQGTLSYSGVINMANFPGSFGLAVTTTSDFEHDPVFFGLASTPTLGAYSVNDLVAPNTYYIVAFADGNNDGEPNGPEPFGYYGTPGAGISGFGIYLSSFVVNVGAPTTGINIQLQDKGAVSGTANVPPNNGGKLVVVVGRGLPGTPGYAPENAEYRFVSNSAASLGIGYDVGLLRPATDYSVFAYVDKNFNGNFDPDEPRFLSQANIAVPSAGNFPLNFGLSLPSVPARPSAFVATSTGTGVEFRWNLVQGATEYRLLDAAAGIVTTLPGNASYYHDTLLPDTSSLIRAIVAANPLGVSASSATVPLTFALAAMPAAPTIAGYSYNYAFLNTGSANHAGTLFELWRATGATADYSRVITIASPGVVDSALAPSTLYYWKWRALNGNGIPTPFTSSTFTVTNAFAGPSIAGQVFYHGGQTGDIVVQTSLSSVFASTASMSILPRLSTQTYFAALSAGDYFIRAFVDINGDGLRQPYEDLGVYGSSIGVTVSAVTNVDFAIAADAVAPASPYNLQVVPGFRQARLNWNIPTTNADGSALVDLAGFIVERTTAAALAFQTIAAPGPLATTYLDAAAIPGVSNIYRVLARDLAGNKSLPTGTISATPSAGGTIRGQLITFSDPTQPGLFKIRVSTLPGQNAPFLAESSLSSYTFTGLVDGQYFVRGFQDRNNDGTLNGRIEPAGTFGGLNNPFPIFITNGNTVNGADVVVCDRTALGVGMSTSPYLTASDCPALDKTPAHRTDLFAFAVGNGAPGSLGLGSRVNLQMNSSFDNELILLGPDGRVVQRDNRAGGSTGFEVTVNQVGVYLVEPTSFLSQDGGGYNLRMSVSGGFAGNIPGTVAYSGSALTGNVVVQLFDRPATDAFPMRISTMAAPGAFTLSGLPDGNFYVRAYRDVNSNGTKDLGEPSGAFGLSESSPTAIPIQGGILSSAIGPVTVTLVDPAFGAVKGAISYSGTQPGAFRIEAGFKDPSCSGCTELRELVSYASTGTGNTYLVNFLPPSTGYVVVAYIDGNSNRKLDPLEAHSSSSPVTVTANSSTTVSFIVRDPGSGASGNATIRGTIDYPNGTKTGPLWVGFARDEHFDYIDYTMQMASTGNFIKPGILGNATYYMVSFLDVNGNGQPDERSGEPLGIGATYYNNAAVKWGTQPTIYVSLSGSVTAYLTLQDSPTGSIYGRVSYSGGAPLSQPLVVQAYLPESQGEFGFQSQTIQRTAGFNDYDFVLNYLQASSSWTVSAFIDANGNQRNDFGEAFGQFGTSQCSGNGPCYGQRIAVSSGAGSTPAYGVSFPIYDPFSGSGSGSGGGFTSSNQGTLMGETFYLGTLGGPFYVRIYNNSSFSGTPYRTVRIPEFGSFPAGPAEARFEIKGLDFGFYSADVFRDPSDTGVYNPMVHPHVQYGTGELTQSRNWVSLHGPLITDPGQGGSVNAFSGSFDAPGGARFDGGATDLATAVAVDSVTAGGPFYYVAGITDQNDGARQWLVRYSSAGQKLASVQLPSVLEANVARLAYVPDAGKLMVGGAQITNNEYTASVGRYAKDLSSLEQVVSITSGDVVSEMIEHGGYLFVQTYPIQSNQHLRKMDPMTMVTVATGSYSFPGPGGNPSPLGLAVAPDGTVYSAVRTGGGSGSTFGQISKLVKYTNGLTPVGGGEVDITPLNIGGDMALAASPSGELYISFADKALGLGKTVKFTSALQQTASASLPVDLRLAASFGNIKVDADGVYEAWGSTSGGGDFMVVRYDSSLNPLYSRRFDGFDGTRMDAAMGLVALSSSNVVAAGVVDNGRNLDWMIKRFDMNASGAASAAGEAVTVTVASAIQGDILYNGALTSGTIRSFLLPYYSDVPVRVSTAPFGVSRPYLFNALSVGLYRIVSFLDRNDNFEADSDEPLAFTPGAGLDFQGTSLSAYNLTLCDRSPLTQGVPVLASLQANDCLAWDHDGAFQKLYTFQGRRGQPVTVSMSAVDFYDTYLMLYDEKGGLVITDDESAGAGNAKIENFILPYDGQYTVAAAAYAPGITGSFRLEFGGSEGTLGGIEGEVQYNGSQGGQIVVGLFNAPDFSSSSYVDGRVLTSTRAFGFASLPTGTTYYLGAFIDVNFNNNPDLGEDGGVLGSNGVPSAIYLQNGQTLGGLVLLIETSSANLVSQSFVNGVATYTGTQFGPVRLEFWSSASFQGRPVAVRDLPTGPGSYDVSLPGDLSYFLRGFMDVNNNFMPDPDEPKGVYSPNNQGAESFFAPASASVGGIDLLLKDPGATAGGGIAGEGTATIAPLAVGAGDGLFIATITYTAGTNGISQNGKVGFILPPGLPFPNSVTAAGDAAISGVTMQGPAAFVTVTAVGGLPLGQKVTFYAELFSPCAVGASTFTVASAKTNAVAPQPLFNGSPVLSITQGAPRSFQPAQPYFAVKQGILSERQTLELRDGCGNKTAAVAPVEATLRAKFFNMENGQFADDSLMGLTTGTLVTTGTVISLPFAVGKSSHPFFVVSHSTGYKNLELAFNLGADTTFYYGINALAADILTQVGLSSSPTGVQVSSMTLGASQSAFINFRLGDVNNGWRIVVSSQPYKAGVEPTPLWERWGYGQPSVGEIAWDGRYSPWFNNGARVQNGLYFIRIEVGSGVRDDSLVVRVNVPQLQGRFFDSGVIPNPPLGSVRINVFGPSGYFFAETDALGNYSLPGLGAGVNRMEVRRDDYLEGAFQFTLTSTATVSTFTALSPAVSATMNASGGLNVLMNRAPALRVSVPDLVGVSTQAYDQWGSLQVRTSTSSANPLQLFAPLRVAAGTTTFDDGGQWDPATQQFVTRRSIKFNVPVGTYTVEGFFPGLSRSSETVYVPTTGSSLTLNAFTPRAQISGLVTLPSNPQGTFVSVNAVPLSTAASASGGFGGVYLEAAVLTGTYTVFGLDAGSYILRANAQGFGAVSSGPVTVSAGQMLAGVDMPVFGTGGQISGNAIIPFSTLGKNLTLYVNAWSPGSMNFGSTQVFVAGQAAPLSIPYVLKGLDVGAQYQMFVNLGGVDSDISTVEQLPLTVVPTAANIDFNFAAASGAVAGTIILPAGSTDFASIRMFGKTLDSPKPQEIGNTFEVEQATKTGNFRCTVDGLAPDVAGFCPVGNSSATFAFTGINTQTVEMNILYQRTGEMRTVKMSIVNGATTTVNVDLSAQTFSISGSINNQVTNTLFNTNPKIVQNAPFIAPPGWPAPPFSSSTARVLAIRQEITDINSAVATDFSAANTRVGFLSTGGEFTISSVPAGVYYVRTTPLRACATCSILVPAVGKLIRVSNADISSVTFTLSDGYSVGGALTLDGGLLDSRVFELTVRNRRQEVVRSTTVYLGDSGLGITANSVNYSFTNLPANEFYTISARDLGSPAKYAGAPIKFPDPSLAPNGLQANILGQDMTLARAAFLVGRLKDANTGELIGKANATLLATNFRISATANPWVEGGFVLAASSVAGRPIQDDGYFRVGPLIPGIPYDLRLGQSSWDAAYLAQGSQNYTPIQVSGLKPGAGESKDVGVLSLNQGQSISGFVRSSGTLTALGNIKIVARPSFGGSDIQIQTYTNPLGKYTLWVSTFISNQYDITAAPRGGNQASDGFYYGEVNLRAVSLLATTTADFLLNPLLASVTGQVVVADAATGGELSYPFGDQKGFPAAAINLQPYGVVSQDPLGDIKTLTDGRGQFSLPGMSTGTYALRATSLGYIVGRATVTVTGAGFRIYTGSDTPSNYLAGNTITLVRGASVSGRVLKSDGSAPNSTEVGGVAAANFAAGEFVIGSVEVDPTAKTVSAYSISGFKTGVSYDLVILPAEKGEDVIFPPEGAGVSFSAIESTTTKNINLTFASAGIDCAATSKALGNSQFQIKIDCTKALRDSLPADNDLEQILSVSTYTSAGAAFVSPNGTGQFLGSDKALSANRRQITAIYRSATNETAFSLRLRATATTINVKTGLNFTVDKVFDFHTGVDANVVSRVTNMQGGSVELQPSAEDETLGLDERSKLDLQAGTFAQEGETNAASTITVSVGMRKGKDRQTISALYASRLGYTPASVTSLRASSYPSEMAAAMSAYRTLASTSQIGGANPLSSFYDIFLPAGIRHQLKQNADLTLSYTLACATCTPTDSINVWFYNATTGRFELENRNRRVDTVNKTITVAVDHFSVFTVLDSTPVLSARNPVGAEKISIVNIPNPADCISHANITRNSSLFPGGGVLPTFRGTMLRYTLPGTAGVFQDAKINIYNVAGELVKTLNVPNAEGQTTNYTPWDCSSDGGGTVSSGVYIGEISWGGQRAFVKIAIIKGSGL